MRLIYPACFYPEENEQYSVVFPDLNKVATYGNTLEEAIEMAEDLAISWLLDNIEENEEIPKPSSVKGIKLEEDNAFVLLISIEVNKG